MVTKMANQFQNQGTQGWQFSLWRLLTVVALWVSRAMLVLSLIACLACGLTWLGLWSLEAELKAVRGQGLATLGPGLGIMFLTSFLMEASVIGCVLAIVGLAFLAVFRKRFGKWLAISLLFNFVAGPVPGLVKYVNNRLEERRSLVRAVDSGSIERLDSRLSWRKPPIKPDEEGIDALEGAVRRGRLDMIHALVTAYAKPKGGPYAVTYEAALCMAVRANNAELVGQLLRLGANPNGGPRAYGHSAAQFAMCAGNRHILKLLLEAGADPSAGYEGGPLSDAVVKGDVDLVKTLLRYYPDRGFKRDPRYGADLLSIAVHKQLEEMARILLDAGADPNVMPPGRHWLPARLPLEEAIRNQCLDTIRLLLERNADPNDRRIRLYVAREGMLTAVQYAENHIVDRAIVGTLRSHGAK